jgi:hypothetical protein
MKKSIKILFGLCLLSSCNIKPDYVESKMEFAVDSVEYHGIGQDNSLQTTPYWRVHLKESEIWLRMSNPTQVGDSVTILLRKQ